MIETVYAILLASVDSVWATVAANLASVHYTARLSAYSWADDNDSMANSLPDSASVVKVSKVSYAS